MTQEEIGAELGVTGVTVGRWEGGIKEPTLETITKLAALLRVRAAWLAFGDGPMVEEGAPPTDPPARSRVPIARAIPVSARKESRRKGA